MKGQLSLFATGKSKRKRRPVAPLFSSERDRAESATAIEAAADREAVSREVAVSLPVLADWEVTAVRNLVVAFLRA